MGDGRWEMGAGSGECGIFNPKSKIQNPKSSLLPPLYLRNRNRLNDFGKIGFVGEGN
jgi:hypothetical protein